MESSQRRICLNVYNEAVSRLLLLLLLLLRVFSRPRDEGGAGGTSGRGLAKAKPVALADPSSKRGEAYGGPGGMQAPCGDGGLDSDTGLRA